MEIKKIVFKTNIETCNRSPSKFYDKLLLRYHTTHKVHTLFGVRYKYNDEGTMIGKTITNLGEVKKKDVDTLLTNFNVIVIVGRLDILELAEKYTY